MGIFERYSFHGSNRIWCCIFYRCVRVIWGSIKTLLLFRTGKNKGNHTIRDSHQDEWDTEQDQKDGEQDEECGGLDDCSVEHSGVVGFSHALNLTRITGKHKNEMQLSFSSYGKCSR